MELPKRKRNRLMNYDYSAGVYFVTICIDKKRNCLCRIGGDGVSLLSEWGKIAEYVIGEIPKKYQCVTVDHSVVMPNHIHLLLTIKERDGTGNPSPTLGNVIGWYKYQVTKIINERTGDIGTRVFQRSYHDHVIRNEKDYQMIWEYIDNNPMRWALDCFYTP